MYTYINVFDIDILMNIFKVMC